MKMRIFSQISWSGLSTRLSDGLNLQNASSSKLVSFLLLAFCLGINIYLRIFPVYFPALERDAVLNVINRYSEKIAKEFKGPRNAMTSDVLSMVQEAIRKDPKAFDKEAAREYAKLKDQYQDENGLTYLMEYDPYAWARWTENVVRYGHPGDKIVNGKSYDSTMLAPNGVEVFHFKLLFYVTAFLYHGVHWINHAVTLKTFIFFIPVFYAACFLLIFYQFVRSQSTDLVAFLAVFLVGLTGESLGRGSAGWYDFDMLSPMMALAVGWCLIESLRGKKRWPERLFYAFLAAFFEGIYALTWLGWWFMLAVAGGFFVLAIAARIIEGLRRVPGRSNGAGLYLMSAAVFFAAVPFFVHFFAGINFIERLIWLKSFVRLDTAISADIWPNVFFTISELTPLSIKGLAARFYNPWIFSAAVLSIPVVIVREWKTERRDATILMLCWFFVMAVASFKSNRFIIYLSVPLFFFFALFAGEYLPAFLQEKLSGLKRIAGVLVYFALVGLLAQTVLKSGIAYAEFVKPMMNDAWHDALVFVDKNTPKDSIINSWWDRGSWFRYYGNRRVVFDGQSHNGQLGHWMARVLLEKDEEKAVRILRMLNNANNNAYYQSLKKITDPFQREAVLEKLLVSTQNDAEKILAANGFSEHDSKGILQALYAKPAPAYFIVEESLFGKMPNISFLGNWDFQKLYAYQHRGSPKASVAANLQRIYGVSPDDAAKLMRANVTAIQAQGEDEALSKRYYFYSETEKDAREGELIYFDNGLVFNPKTRDALIYSRDDGKYKIPKKIVFLENGQMSEIKKANGNDDRVVLLIKQGEKHSSLLADEALVESLLVRLFLLQGRGLKHFKPFYSDEENKIYIYAIQWDQNT